VVQTPEGDLEPDVLTIVGKIGDWTAANGEGIYATRPWKVYGEGPSTVKANQRKGPFGGLSDTRGYHATDFRFTTKDGKIYAYCMNVPEGDITIASFGKNSKMLDKSIESVSMLGSTEKLKWTQTADGLFISKPTTFPAWKVTGYKIELKK
jgi:alpha-L-fucosidase